MNKSFWLGKKVFVTGHTGFKGGWLSLWLQNMGAQVTGYALSPSTHPNLFESASVASGVNSFIGDVRELDTLQKVMQDAQPEIVFHLAAQSLVRYSYANPVETYATNVMGTVHVLEAARHAGSVKAIVCVTSDKCYENKEWVWAYRENEPMGGYDPYSNSKGCAELVASAYRNSFMHPDQYQQHGIALATARAGNVVGGGDWSADRLIPDIIKAIVAGQTVSIRSPNAIRPWQHVLEPLHGYMLLAEKLFMQGAHYAQAWNFGPNEQDAKTVEWLTEALIRTWGEGANYKIESNNTLHEAHYLKLDSSKARHGLDWQPRWNAAQTIARIAAWYKAQLSGQDMRTYCITEIKEYLQASH